MRILIKHIVFGLLLIGGISVKAQQDAIFTQYMFNPFMINPAYAGSQDYLVGTIQGRYQWQGFSADQPRTFAASGHALLSNDINGVGASIVQDKASIISQTYINGSFSHRLIFKRTTLALGLNGGGTIYTADYSSLNLKNTADNSFNEGANQTKILPNFGAGLFFYSSRFYLGLSLPRFLSNPLNDNEAKAIRHYYFNAGYVFPLGNSLKLKPNFQLRYAEGAPIQMDMNLNLLIYDIIWFGFSYRSLESLDLLLEINLNDQLRLGYSYDMGINDFSEFHNGSHEFMLSYKFVKHDNVETEKKYTPRYF